MKKYLLLLLVAQFSFGQIPTGYYNTASGTGYVLKTNLKKIIDNINDAIPSEHLHVDQGYGALWTLYTQAAFRDNYYENDGSLLDIYSENATGVDPYNYTSTTQQCGSYSSEGQCYNREHLVPQSYFDNFAVDPMKNDAFHVFPSDGKVNGDRGNLGFGIVSTASYTSQNGSKRGPNTINGFSNYSGSVFEPINAFKGDVARAYFYFATRYEDTMDDFYAAANSSSCEAKNMFDGSINKVFSDNFILILIKWHIEDPVSAKEIAQNNAIYAHQSNRNPYIDHPEYVCQIWNTQCNTVNSLSNNSSFLSDNSVTIYPNPTNTNEIEIATEESISKLTLINVNGQIVKEVSKPIFNQNTYKINNLPQGFYFLQITAEKGNLTKKIIVN
jgi:endonuclease I